jgi:peroxiredoxin
MSPLGPAAGGEADRDLHAGPITLWIDARVQRLKQAEPMKQRWFASLIAAGLAMPAIAALDAGDTAPAFQARASLAGEEFDFSLAEALEQGMVVVYFYPSAYTQGCNVQAHEFAVNMDEFEAAGASVIGVSLDSIERLNDFSADPEYCAGKLPVASDESGEIARSYGLEVADGRPGIKDTRGVEIDHGFAERTTFVVTPDGKVAETIGGMSPMENVRKSLQAVQRLAKSG